MAEDKMPSNEIAKVDGRELTVTKVFQAPRELVFKAWTEPEHLKHWWGPVGFDLHIAAFDLKPGGLFHYHMQNAEGHEMWAKFVFREVAEPGKLVYVISFSDVDGNTVRAPFSELYPMEVLNIVTFTEEDGQTIMTLRSGPIDATEEEVSFFYSMHASMQQGFGATFDQLDKYLAKQSK